MIAFLCDATHMVVTISKGIQLFAKLTSSCVLFARIELLTLRHRALGRRIENTGSLDFYPCLCLSSLARLLDLNGAPLRYGGDCVTPIAERKLSDLALTMAATTRLEDAVGLV